MNKDMGKAESSLRKALEIDPNIPEFYSSLRGFYLRRQKVDKAVTEFCATLERNPNSIQSHMALGTIYKSQKKYDLAKSTTGRH